MDKIDELLSNLEKVERKYFPGKFIEQNKDKASPVKNSSPKDENLLESIENERYFYKKEIAILSEYKKFMEKALKEKEEEYDIFKSEYFKNNQLLLAEITRLSVENESLRNQRIIEKQEALRSIAVKDNSLNGQGQEIKKLTETLKNLSDKIQNILLNGVPATDAERERQKKELWEEYEYQLLKFKTESEEKKQLEIERILSEKRKEFRTEIADLLSGEAHSIKKTTEGIIKKCRDYLGIIDFYLAALSAETKNNLEADKQLTGIERALSDFKNDLTNCLSVFNLPDLEIKRLDLFEMVKNVLISCEVLISEKKIKIIYEKERNFYLDTDPVLLFKVLSGVISNSIEAIPPFSGGKIEIKVLPEKAIEKTGSRDCVIKIIDTGTGIKYEDLEKLPGPFFTKRKGFAGLGLFQAKYFMNLLGGDLKIDSRQAPEEISSATAVSIIL